jgi:uncharacterized SAM-binding protein YcdF (DUF218 family)/lysophospholipase L1-like esterase
MSAQTVATASPGMPVSRTAGRWRRVRGPIAWMLVGVALVFGVRKAVNRGTWPDRLVGPLLLSDTTGLADVIVVPAAGVTGACTSNLNSIQRTLLAARLFDEHRAPLVLFSGGIATGTSCAVADVMAALARRLGVPSERILVERASRTTWENAESSAPLLQGHGARTILLVTDRLHMWRTQAAFERFGFRIERTAVPVYDGHRDNVEMLYMALRETVAIRYYRALGRIGGSLGPAGGQAPAAPPARGTKPMTLANPTGPVVLLGASYAAGWKAPRLGGVALVNRGVAGQQSFELLARFDADVLPAKPRAVIIWGFINDVFRSSREKVGDALTRSRKSTEEMVQRARANGIEPILATEVTVRQKNTFSDNVMTFIGGVLGRESYPGYVNAQVLANDKWLRAYAEREGLLLLDLQPVLSDASGYRRSDLAVDDGSHISEAGYRALTAYADPLLTTYFRAR